MRFLSISASHLVEVGLSWIEAARGMHKYVFTRMAIYYEYRLTFPAEPIAWHYPLPGFKWAWYNKLCFWLQNFFHSKRSNAACWSLCNSLGLIRLPIRQKWVDLGDQQIYLKQNSLVEKSLVCLVFCCKSRWSIIWTSYHSV